MKHNFIISNVPFTCEYPDECPICNSKIFPNKHSEIFNKSVKLVSIFFSCPACGKGFISHYEYNPIRVRQFDNMNYNYLELIDSYPKFPKQKKFDNTIENLSPSFTKIYNQAVAAESYNLDLISGMSYRKALEFLIKDYCIFRNKNEESKIKSMQLGQVIDLYIDSPKIKNLAKASTWIGNDETHYTKKFENKDINDLKRFIDTTVAFITYDLISDDADNLVASK